MGCSEAMRIPSSVWRRKELNIDTFHLHLTEKFKTLWRKKMSLPLCCLYLLVFYFFPRFIASVTIKLFFKFIFHTIIHLWDWERPQESQSYIPFSPRQNSLLTSIDCKKSFRVFQWSFPHISAPDILSPLLSIAFNRKISFF